jgi:predicted Fe-Mo cluster-binding NifX family protein
MESVMKLAVPTMGQGGLDGERSGHFGHCDCFTIVDIKNGNIENVSILENPPHIEGGCLRPVNLLADAGVNTLIAAGMGARPLMGFQGVGITVYFENETQEIDRVVDMLISEKLTAMLPENACQH